MRFTRFFAALSILTSTSASPLARADCNDSFQVHLLTSEESAGFHAIFKKYFTGVEQAELHYHPEANLLVKEAEVPTAGTLVRSAADFENLPDGVYSLIIDSDGDTVFVPRTVFLDQKTIEENGGKFLGTHRSALAKLKEIKNNPRIIASIQFEISLSHVNNISPRSGTFRGGRVHFDFAIEYLKSLGMKIEERTIFVPVPADGSDPFLPHVEAYEDAQYRILVFNHPDLKRLADQANELKRKLVELFPDPAPDDKLRGGPGKINVDAVQQIIIDHRREFFAAGMNFDDRFIVATYLGLWFNKGEGVSMSIGETYKMNGFAKAKMYVDVMNKVYQFLLKLETTATIHSSP